MTSTDYTQPHLAIVEMTSQSDLLPNLIAIEQAVKTASEQQAALVVLPENAFCFGNQPLASRYFAELRDWASKLAGHYHVFLLAGTLPCPYRPDGTPVPEGKFRQSSLLFDPAGSQLARYDKIHLFKAQVNDQVGQYDEGRTFEAGNQIVTAKTPFATIGLTVCFDLRFAPLALRLRQQGADIITAPSAFTYDTGRRHWQSLLIARALDSQCLIIGAGQSGVHPIYKNDQYSERHTWGHSQFVNANGETVGISTTTPTRPSNDDLPISHIAKSWLPASNAALSLTDNTLTTDYRLITANFDQAAQQAWRQQIDLSSSQRFGINDPSDP